MSDRPNESHQFYKEINSIVERWIHESEDLSVFEMLGALEAVKATILDALAEHNEEKNDEH